VIEPLRIVFDVDAEPDHAFWIWTRRASMWWPPSHTTAKRKGTSLVFEPGPGGRVFERDPDGNEVDWGSVLVWEPPRRLVYLWHIFADASDATEVEVRFLPNGDGTTRVELEHRGWDAFDGGGGEALKALAVYPGQPNPTHLRDAEEPRVSDSPDGRGVLVRVLRVDGTDVLLEPLAVAEKAINQAFEIQRRLRVWQPRRAAVLGSGAVGLLTTLILRLRGIEVACLSRRRPPHLKSELIEEIGGAYLSTQDTSIAEAAGVYGPFDIIVEATGFSPLVFEAAESLGKNGVLVLVGVTGGDRRAEVRCDAINQGFVLGNKVMVGSVNASPDDFARGRDDLVKASAFYPGWLEKLLTTPVPGLAGGGQAAR